jgi:hypothetical protein
MVITTTTITITINTTIIDTTIINTTITTITITITTIINTTIINTTTTKVNLLSIEQVKFMSHKVMKMLNQLLNHYLIQLSFECINLTLYHKIISIFVYLISI